MTDDIPRVLVTGATGFVGSHALDALSAEKSVEVIAACRDANRLSKSFKGEVRIGDIHDKAYLASLFDGIDTVCNAFAWTSLYNHADESRDLYLNPSLELIDQAIKAGVKTFINISSTSAASPSGSADPMSQGIPRNYWPHLSNVVAIEDYLRTKADSDFSVINLRVGLFVGNRYALGLLPILLPRLKTHLVPWVSGGNTRLPLVDGRDIGQAFSKAAVAERLKGYQSFNIVGPSVPTVREVIEFLHERGYPKPHFNVSFPVAFAFAWLMEKIDPVVPWEPLVTRSIIHLLREVNADNRAANEAFGYVPQYDWRDAVKEQLSEMDLKQDRPMSMAVPKIK